METVTNSEQLEISDQKDKELFKRLGEVRQRVLTVIEPSEKTNADKILNTGTYIGIFSLIGILLLLITGFLLQFAGLLPSQVGGTTLLVIFSILLAGCVFGVSAIPLSFLLKLINFLRRNEVDRALETYERIYRYKEQGRKSFSGFDTATLENIVERIENQTFSSGTENGSFDSVIKYLPPAVGYSTLVVLALFLFDARKITAILSDPQVTNLALLQKEISNQVFTAVNSSVHPFIIYNILMLALVFIAVTKITPVLTNIATVRQSRRYRDYLIILQEAKEIKSKQEIQKLTVEATVASDAPNKLLPPAAIKVFNATKEKAASRLTKNGAGKKSRRRK